MCLFLYTLYILNNKIQNKISYYCLTQHILLDIPTYLLNKKDQTPNINNTKYQLLLVIYMHFCVFFNFQIKKDKTLSHIRFFSDRWVMEIYIWLFWKTCHWRSYYVLKYSTNISIILVFKVLDRFTVCPELPEIILDTSSNHFQYCIIYS